MAIDYIITSALNLSQDQVQSLSTSRNQDTLNIYLLLINKHPICPYCGADTSSKGLLTYTFKTQDIAGLKQLSIGNVDGISVVTVIALLVKTISLPLMVCTPPSLWSIKS